MRGRIRLSREKTPVNSVNIVLRCFLIHDEGDCLLLCALITATVLAQKRPRADSDYEGPQAAAAPSLPAPLLQELAAIRDVAYGDYASAGRAPYREYGPRP